MPSALGAWSSRTAAATVVWPRASWLTTWVCWTNALPIFTAHAMVVLARATRTSSRRWPQPPPRGPAAWPAGAVAAASGADRSGAPGAAADPGGSPVRAAPPAARGARPARAGPGAPGAARTAGEAPGAPRAGAPPAPGALRAISSDLPELPIRTTVAHYAQGPKEVHRTGKVPVGWLLYPLQSAAPPGRPDRGVLMRARKEGKHTLRLEPLLERLPADPAFTNLLQAIEAPAGGRAGGGQAPAKRGNGVHGVVADVARAFLLAGLARWSGRLVVAVTATTADAEALVHDVGAFLGRDLVDCFPAWETLPHERLSPRSETVAKRLSLLHRLQPERDGKGTVRGGLVDLFPPGEDHPVRVEFWGDEVEGIRSFAVASQRSLTELPSVEAYPCREVRLSATERNRARQLAGEVPVAGDLLARVAEGLDVEGVESLLPLLYDELPTLPDYLPAGSVLVVVDPKRTVDRAEEVRKQAEEAMQASWGTAAEGSTAPLEGAAYRPLDQVLERSGRARVRLGALDAGRPDAVRIEARPIEPYRANVTRIAADARELAGEGYTVLLTTEGSGPAERLVDVLGDEGLTVPLTAELPASQAPDGELLAGTAPLLNGFRLPALRLALLAEGDLYGTRRQTREQARMPASRRRASHDGGAQFHDVAELQPGDIVVHAVHGIGRYVGMEHRTVGGAERDYLLLAYDQGDRLYLPTDQVEMISRYVGGESPKLSRLGTREWDRQKARVRRKVREIAAELIRLYAARMASPGHAFAPDSPWQRELEDAFPYAETPDQLTAIEEIKADMETPVPMDRLLCGDVGYGKTEVAVRAAFKAVMDGKKVAVLVPTTLLAQQHLATFSERFAPFPVRVGVLSRFASRKEQEETLTAMANGTVDLVIGTHRLLSADAKWSDLGLAVIDEEHRFGVAHKEHLKQLRTEVDVLTLTATPIPRSMEMSLSGIRDMSVMETPPEQRHPVLTFVGPYDV